MSRNQVQSSKTQIKGLKKQVQKYDSLQTGSSFLGFSKKKKKFVIKKQKVRWY